MFSNLSKEKGETKSEVLRRLLRQESERCFVVPAQYFDELLETLEIPDSAPAIKRAARLSQESMSGPRRPH